MEQEPYLPPLLGLLRRAHDRCLILTVNVCYMTPSCTCMLLCILLQDMLNRASNPSSHNSPVLKLLDIPVHLFSVSVPPCHPQLLDNQHRLGGDINNPKM